MTLNFSRRLMLALAALLLAYGALMAVVGRQLAIGHEQESQQRLSRGLARHIVEHWPEVARADVDGADRKARESLLNMLMVVNPGIDVYLLDADGRVDAYIGEPGMVRVPQVDIAQVRSFIGGAELPMLGTDPKTPGRPKIFSAAMFPTAAGDSRPPGYLYVVLDGEARARVADDIGPDAMVRNALALAAIGLVITLLLGIWIFHRLTQPLKRLAQRMHQLNVDSAASDVATRARPATATVEGDEIVAIDAAFDSMAQRISDQVRAQSEQAAAHRDVMANVAHDLRTPLTALHGHLEFLGRPDLAADDATRQRHVAAALSQSDKVRRLSQQLFELATLQSTDRVLQRERFRLDELVTDTVQKFELTSPVALNGVPPGPVDLDGDLQLIERALTNLIDNAVRHAGPVPVHVSMECDGTQVKVLVEDRGPGLPAELARRLNAGRPVRDPPLQRPGGGIGGLGLAIAQRIASLHGGSLSTLPAPDGGTRLCLSLPRA